MLEALLIFFIVVGVIVALSARFGTDFLIWGIGSVIYLGAFTLSAVIDYAFNAGIINAIPPEAVGWWHFFTFDHYMTWQFVNNLELFFIITGICSVFAGLAFLFTVKYEEM
jgi:hypothetical protein